MKYMKSLPDPGHEYKESECCTRLVPRMANCDSSRTALERGYHNESEMVGSREESFRYAQAYRNREVL